MCNKEICIREMEESGMKIKKGMKKENAQSGQALTEYGLLIALIAVLVITVLTLLGGRLVTAFNKIIAAFPPS